MHRSLPLTVLLATASAQQSGNIVNPSLPVRGCGDLACASSVNNSICGADGLRELGVGFVANAVQLPTTNLSLTLIDGEPLYRAETVFNTPYWISTRSLYFGAPSDAALTSAPPACALMMQYQGATFPYYKDNSEAYQNSTSCPAILDPEHLVPAIQQFSYEGGNASSVSRCEALASYVEQYLADKTLDLYYGALIKVMGSAVSGPDANTTSAQISYSFNGPSINSDACMPVLPQDFTLHPATSAQQPLRDAALSQNDTYGGRDGFTPILTVVYGDDDAIPDVRLYCMHLWNKFGQSLEYSSRQLEGVGPATFGRVGGFAAIIASLVVGAAVML